MPSPRKTSSRPKIGRHLAKMLANKNKQKARGWGLKRGGRDLWPPRGLVYIVPTPSPRRLGGQASSIKCRLYPRTTQKESEEARGQRRVLPKTFFLVISNFILFSSNWWKKQKHKLTSPTGLTLLLNPQIFRSSSRTRTPEGWRLRLRFTSRIVEASGAPKIIRSLKGLPLGEPPSA